MGSRGGRPPGRPRGAKLRVRTWARVSPLGGFQVAGKRRARTDEQSVCRCHAPLPGAGGLWGPRGQTEWKGSGWAVVLAQEAPNDQVCSLGVYGVNKGQ